MGIIVVTTWQKISVVDSEELNNSAVMSEVEAASTIESHTGGTATIIVESSSDEEMTQLQEEIFRLKMEIVKAKQLVNSTKAEMHAIQNGQLKRVAKMRVEVSYDELLTTIPEPFTSAVTEMSGTFADHFMRFYKEPQDTAWAYDTEDKITNAILSSPLGTDIQLQQVTCKTTMCEVRGFQSTTSSWMKLANSLSKVDGLPFKNSQSSNNYHSDYGSYFYVLLSKN